MRKNPSEKLTVRLSKNSFLNMYVYGNPNKKYLPNGHCDEFCDCFIHMASYDIVIQIKSNDDQNANDWFHRQVLGKARKQLTMACLALSIPDFEIWDKNNKNIISKCNQDYRNIYPVIVFKKDGAHRYQQVALSVNSENLIDKRIYCNIFSMEDFEYATSMIPTGVDFVNYLTFRFNKMCNYEAGYQLFPLFPTKGGYGFNSNASTNEQILVSEFYSHISIEPEKVFINAKRWHENIVGFYNDNVNKTLVQLLSYLSIKNILEWDKLYIKLLNRSKTEECIWYEEPVLIGRVDNKDYGIILSFTTQNRISKNIKDDTEQLIKCAHRAITKHSLEEIFIFQYTDSEKVRVLRVEKQNE